MKRFFKREARVRLEMFATIYGLPIHKGRILINSAEVCYSDGEYSVLRDGVETARGSGRLIAAIVYNYIEEDKLGLTA